jgi:hypothetical protein
MIPAVTVLAQILCFFLILEETVLLFFLSQFPDPVVCQKIFGDIDEKVTLSRNLF